MKKKQAWDYALGLIQVDGLEPSKDFLNLVEKEKKGEITTADMKKLLDSKYKVVKSSGSIKTSSVANKKSMAANSSVSQTSRPIQKKGAVNTIPPSKKTVSSKKSLPKSPKM
ncbi:hypothetical protein MmiAt1_10130 [Methanimicrococcus sp. At1]|uniref:Uncharacterized protein n=1 Tax=Methanimicrococcus hacksteinii TaxID=3028293 RepID=A0ABU3VRA6_9EURY|nr:antitoxin VbhA family protein [Methanimicrococcus sp. At1]MDV0445435.1 hypothetical protein [Methanimicrococcus sp. At1]